MALNINTFKTRTVTAIVFAAIMLLALLGNGYLLLGLLIVITFGGLYEYAKLVKNISPKSFKGYLPLGLFYIFLPLALLARLGFSEIAERNGHYFISNSETYSYLLPCAIVFSIWINDTMAYIVGSLIGKTPLSSISPKKTWEGTLGGGLLCIAVIGLLGNYIPAAQILPVMHWLIIAGICAFFGSLGDLLESKLKRAAGVKDSGTFMPGHGGFLDRFDSLLIATPIVFIYVKWIMNFI
ncbi:MAG: phosphatidate cytidylyltransferase [Niastella sp.]|nr:phosphatidate cytidylyltransferase [Niastella sp.]